MKNQVIRHICGCKILTVFSVVAVLFLLQNLLSSNVYAQSRSTILWATNDAPPFYITSGQQKHEGFGDLIQKLIIDHMPDYEHRYETLPLKRVLTLMENRQPVCFSTWIYKTRPDLVHTSIPYLYYYPHGVVVTKKTYEKLGSPKILSLDELLNRPDIVFGQPLGRGYGEQLDPIVKRYQDEKNIYVRSGEDSTQGIFKMLQLGRIDYTIEYPYTMLYFSRELKMQDQLTFVPLKENRDIGLLGAIACTNTDWGLDVLKGINRAIIEIRNLREHKEILKRWVVIEGQEDDYWQIYEKQVIRPFELMD